MASSEPATELGNALSQCGLNLPLAPQEPTYLSLDREFISGSPQRLSVRVDAPYGATAADVTVSQDCEWQYPFRLARVLTRLPVEGIPFLYPDAWRTKIDSIINNLIASASLVIPSTPPASGYTTLKLRAVARPSDDPRLFNCVLIEIPVPIGITLRHGAIISLRISVCGIPITVDIPAKGHIHSGTCKHTQEGKGAVWSAAYASDVAALESALAAGGSTEEADEDGNTALVIAAYDGNLEVARILLAAGADINAKDASGWSPIHVAASEGHILVVEAFLKEPGVSPGDRTINGMTPLHLASSEGRTAVVQALLADPRVSQEEKNIAGEKARDLAARYHYVDVVQMLEAAASSRTFVE